MDDTSSGTSPLIPSISLAGVNLSLGQGAARVHILKGVTLNIGRGEAVGLIRPSRTGQATLLMVIAGHEASGHRSRDVAGAENRKRHVAGHGAVRLRHVRRPV